jgi:D-glycero-D-manno-heptose 1,7-bisphosphate phosphatase
MKSRPALFLDRDGVINVDHGYVCTPERTEFVDGIFDLVRTANRRNYLVVVVTNQAGIARGFYSEGDFRDYMAWLGGEFERHGSWLDAVYYCPHHPTAGDFGYSGECSCRKPAPGLILAARNDLGMDLAASVLVGDKPSDIAAGHAAGVGLCVKVDAIDDAVGAASVQTLLDVERVLGERASMAANMSGNVQHPLIIRAPLAV